MRNTRRRNYDDEYGSGYPLPERRPRNHAPRREIGQSVVAKLLSTVTEEALKSAVFSVALAVPAIRRTVFSLFLAAFLLGAILMAVLIYGVTRLSNSFSQNTQEASQQLNPPSEPDHR